jgi:uncharacterized low-complexity protein
MNKKSILVGAFVLGAFTLGNANTFANLGTGNDVRESVASEGIATFVKHTSDLSCGDKKGKKAVKKDTTAGKSKEMKCGEGKCGDKKAAKKTAPTKK